MVEKMRCFWQRIFLPGAVARVFARIAVWMNRCLAGAS
jgi:hypothetical protein